MAGSRFPRSRFIVVVAAVLAGSAVLAISFSQLGLIGCLLTSPELSSTTASAERRYVTALGKIEPEDGLMKLAAPSFEAGPSIVEKLLVAEGDSVTAGQTVATLKSLAQYQADLAAAESALDVARTRWEQAGERRHGGEVAAAKARVRSTAAEAKRAEAEYRRFAALFETGAISATDEMRYRTEHESRKESAMEAVESLRRLESDRAMDLDVADAELREALSNLDRAKTRVELGIVAAPSSGRILKVHARSGEVVTDKGVVEMAATDRVVVIAEVYESDVRLVERGQRVVVSSIAWTHDLEGEVEAVGGKVNRNEVMGPDPVTDADARVVRVRIRLDDPAAASPFVNLQASVAIEIL